jgi:two-component system response regulator FixJ
MLRPMNKLPDQNMEEARNVILVVDDDLAVRESLKFELELEGLTVHACGSGAELLANPLLERAQCLVLDYKMPRMDGFEVLNHIAARGLQLPVILITGPVTDALRTRAEEAGVLEILEKPFAEGALLGRIRRLLH